MATIAIVGVVATFAYLNANIKPEGGHFLASPFNDIEVEFQNHLAKFGRNYGTKEEYYYRLGLFTQIYHTI